MANVKISELSSASSLTGTEIIPLVQSGSTVKTTAQDIADLAGGGGVSYTSYVAIVSGDSPVTSSVFENTTGLTFTWASGSSYEPAYSYTTTISSVDPTKIAVFLAGEAVLFDEKGTTVIFPKPAYNITTVNSTTATIDIFYDRVYFGAPIGIPITVEVRIYP
jgi:hypothetical protein